jgi:hypothetical protein
MDRNVFPTSKVTHPRNNVLQSLSLKLNVTHDHATLEITHARFHCITLTLHIIPFNQLHWQAQGTGQTGHVIGSKYVLFAADLRSMNSYLALKPVFIPSTFDTNTTLMALSFSSVICGPGSCSLQ